MVAVGRAYDLSHVSLQPIAKFKQALLENPKQTISSAVESLPSFATFRQLHTDKRRHSRKFSSASPERILRSRGLPRRSWSLEIALNTVLSVGNLQRSCLLRQTFWDATQASCDHQKKFSNASFSTVTWSPLKAVASAQPRIWTMNCFSHRLDHNNRSSKSPQRERETCVLIVTVAIPSSSAH